MDLVVTGSSARGYEREDTTHTCPKFANQKERIFKLSTPRPLYPSKVFQPTRPIHSNFLQEPEFFRELRAEIAGVLIKEGTHDGSCAS
jgi:hypothetical protein